MDSATKVASCGRSPDRATDSTVSKFGAEGPNETGPSSVIEKVPGLELQIEKISAPSALSAVRAFIRKGI